MRRSVLGLVAILLVLAFAIPCLAIPSGLRKKNGEIYDDWNLCRTRSWGKDGFFQIEGNTFRPAIAFESVGRWAGVAWQVGQSLERKYSGDELAEHIFSYARDRVRYTPDVDQFGYEEFAVNADELAGEVENLGSGEGDCEDYAILLAVMFRAAGYRSAVVLAPSHAATLVFMPDYSRANVFWRFKGESGWIWAEATGRNNPLGWTPSQFIGSSDLLAYEITPNENVFAAGRGEAPSSGKEGPSLGPVPFSSIIFLLWILPLFRRR